MKTMNHYYLTLSACRIHVGNCACRLMSYTLVILICLLFFIPASGQNDPVIDSLENELRKYRAQKKELGQSMVVQHDTMVVQILNELSKHYCMKKPDQAEELGLEALSISEILEYETGRAVSSHRIGYANLIKGKFYDARSFLNQALEIRKKQGNMQDLADIYNDVGQAHFFLGYFSEATSNQFEALRIHEQNGNKKGIAKTHYLLGNIYTQIGQYSDAENVLRQAIKNYQAVNEKSGIMNSLISLSIAYEIQKKFRQAIEYITQAIEIADELGLLYSKGVALNSLGVIYAQLNEHQKAIEHFNQVIAIFEPLNNESILAKVNLSIAEIMIQLKDYNKADFHISKGLSIAHKTGEISSLMLAYELSATLDSSRADYRNALENYKKHIIFRDSLVSSQTMDKITKSKIGHEHEKQRNLEKDLQDLKNAEMAREHDKQAFIRNTLIGGLGVLFLFTGLIWRQRNIVGKEKIINESLLKNIFPESIAAEIKSTGAVRARSYTMASVLFADFTGFTRVSTLISAELLVEEIHQCFSAFDQIVQKHGVEKIKTIGDAYMCASGIPESNLTHAADIVKVALEMRSFIHKRKEEKELRGEPGFNIRIGISTGPLVAGVVGKIKYAYDIWGDTVNTAARIEQISEPGEITIGQSTYELIKDQFNCHLKGTFEARNKGMIELYIID